MVDFRKTVPREQLSSAEQSRPDNLKRVGIAVNRTRS
jgi:hypothetical protein